MACDVPRVFDCQGFARDFEAEAPVALKKPGMSTACDCDIWEFVLLSGDVNRCQRGWCAGDIYIAARYISHLGYAGYRGERQEIYLVLEYELSAVADTPYIIVRLECTKIFFGGEEWINVREPACGGPRDNWLFSRDNPQLKMQCCHTDGQTPSKEHGQFLSRMLEAQKVLGDYSSYKSTVDTLAAKDYHHDGVKTLHLRMKTWPEYAKHTKEQANDTEYSPGAAPVEYEPALAQ